MVTPLTSGALATVEAVKDAIGLGAISTAQENRLRRSINVASSTICRHIDRDLARATITAERHSAERGPRLVVRRTPIVSVTSVAVGDTTPIVIDPSVFVVEHDEAGIIFFRTALPTFGYRRAGIAQDAQPGTEYPDLIVAYVGGYITPEQADVGGAYVGETVTLPAEIEEAAIRLAAHMYQSPIGFVAGEVASERLGDASITYRNDTDVGGRQIPSHIRAMLDPFKRVIIV